MDIIIVAVLLLDFNNGFIIQWIKTRKQGSDTWEIQLPVSFSANIYNVVQGMYKDNGYVDSIYECYTICGLGLASISVWNPWGGAYGFFIMIGI